MNFIFQVFQFLNFNFTAASWTLFYSSHTKIAKITDKKPRMIPQWHSIHGEPSTYMQYYYQEHQQPAIQRVVNRQARRYGKRHNKELSRAVCLRVFRGSRHFVNKAGNGLWLHAPSSYRWSLQTVYYLAVHLV